MGWVVLGIIAFLGNIYLFSGYDVDSDLAVFLVGIGLLFDIYIAYLIGKTICARIRADIQEEKAQRITTENQRIDSLKSQISQIKNRYMPIAIGWSQLGQPTSFRTELINQDVVASVRQYKQSISIRIKEYENIRYRINSILEHSEIEDPEKQADNLQMKLDYLRMKEPRLCELKHEIDQICRDISTRKIQLLNENDNVLTILQKAFQLLKASKKCISETMDIVDFIVDRTPKELDMFQYQHKPVVLWLDDLYYCLFSHMILVFDANGCFSTALDPTAFEISVERRTDSVYEWAATLYHKYTDTDSKKVQEDQTSLGRLSIYEYGVVTISLAKKSVVFTVSSQDALARLPYAGIEYAQKYNHLHNPTSDLIKLLKCLLGSDNNEIVHGFEYAYDRRQNNENYFCKEVSIPC